MIKIEIKKGETVKSVMSRLAAVLGTRGGLVRSDAKKKAAIRRNAERRKQRLKLSQ